MHRLLPLAILAFTFSACVDDAAPPAQASASDRPIYAPGSFDETTGGLDGIVTDDASMPLGSVQIVLPASNLTTYSDAEGRFSFSFLAPGVHELQALALGFNAVSRSVEVFSDQLTHVTIALAAVPVQEAFHVTHEKVGRMGCAYAHRSPTPVYPKSYTDACGHANRYSGVRIFNADFQVFFNLTNANTSQLASLVFETVWTPNQAGANGLSVPWGLSPAFFDFGEPAGRSPLYHVANQTVIQAASARVPTVCVWHGKCPVWSATYPSPETLGPTYPVDITFVVDQPFTHYVTEFNFEPAPMGFSALRDT